MAGTLYLGTSGFAFSEWKGTFYPERIRSQDMLAHYAARFHSVEINYSFRHLPSSSALHAWVEATPQTFRFSLKAHQLITHRLRLDWCGEPVRVFVERARELGPRLGPILFQLPPTLRFDGSLLEAFADELPHGASYVFEFRHPSWEEAAPLLARRGIATCISETDEHPAAPDERGAPIAYLRLRKTRYKKRELEAWAVRIVSTLDAGRDVFCYFKHEERATGPRLARRLATMVGPDRMPPPTPVTPRRRGARS